MCKEKSCRRKFSRAVRSAETDSNSVQHFLVGWDAPTMTLSALPLPAADILLGCCFQHFERTVGWGEEVGEEVVSCEISTVCER